MVLYAEHGTQTAEVHIDTLSIPAIRRDELLEAMTVPLTVFYANPENQKKFEAWLVKRRAAGKEAQ